MKLEGNKLLAIIDNSYFTTFGTTWIQIISA